MKKERGGEAKRISLLLFRLLLVYTSSNVTVSLAFQQRTTALPVVLPHRVRYRGGTSGWPLLLSKKEHDTTESNDKETAAKSTPQSNNYLESNPLWKSIQDTQDRIQTVQNEFLEQYQNNIPQPVREWLHKLGEFLTQLRNAVLGFGAGVVLTVALVLVPVVHEMETLSPPVTLFETILSDLETAYVDEVDTTQLFETGIAAMLNSLDPYTEFENLNSAAELNESIDGKYGGVGLVISGQTTAAAGSKATSQAGGLQPNDNNDSKSNIRVASAMEGYAYDYGMRVGDRIVSVDDWQLSSATSVEDVRNHLRGTPGTSVRISFSREGVDEVQTITLPRTIVRVHDVKLATLLPNRIGYIQLSGFTNDAGAEMRNAIQYLQQKIQDEASTESIMVTDNTATAATPQLEGLILDLRGNPGGLLTSAVDVASLFVPNGSDIVSARGRGFPGILYRSRTEPMLDTSRTKLAVLVNDNTASAAEIVSGAIQDLDVGIIVGSDRTYGKGLVQNVEELPYKTALKYTVAKYYTPSGRCIQGVNYKEGSISAKGEGNSGQYTASKIEDDDRKVFYTRTGRIVKDGGGIEADYKVEAPKASALEVTLLRSGLFNEFAAIWSKNHELTNNFQVDDETYRSFQAFVQEKQRKGEIKLDVLYSKPLEDLKKALAASGYKGPEKDVQMLQSSIVREVQRDFEKYRNDIKEDIGQNILARYLPESMLIERGIKSDRQVQAAVELLSSKNKFETILARGSSADRATPQLKPQPTMALTQNTDRSSSEDISSSHMQVTWK